MDQCKAVRHGSAGVAIAAPLLTRHLMARPGMASRYAEVRVGEVNG